MEADVTIIGLGPAGLQAAIHAARKKVKVVAIGKSESSSLHKAEIDNYFGIEHMAGKDLLRIGQEQAKKFGAEFLEEEVIDLTRVDDNFVTVTDHDHKVSSRALVLATGVSREKLCISGERKYLGKGVSYCASCDGGFFKDRPVVVIGEESEAAESAMLLMDMASKVYWVYRQLRVSSYMLEKVKRRPVEMLQGNPIRIFGRDTVTGLELDNGKLLNVQGVFIALGAKSSMDLALELGILPDSSGRIKVDENCCTEMKMVYACGDLTGIPWQLARAVGQGCVAGDNAAKAVREVKS